MKTRLCVGLHVVAALGNACALAGTAAQVIELGPAHYTAADHGDAVHDRRVEREHALHAFAKAHLAHGEVRAHAPVGAGDHHTFVILDALAGAFDNLHAHAHRITGAEFGYLFASLGNFFRFDLLDQVHWSVSFVSCRASEAGWPRAPLWRSQRSGLRNRV